MPIDYDTEQDFKNIYWDDVRNICNRIPSGMAQEMLQTALWQYADMALLDDSCARAEAAENLENTFKKGARSALGKKLKEEVTTLADNIRQMIYPEP